jgi:hypothetical protein
MRSRSLFNCLTNKFPSCVVILLAKAFKVQWLHGLSDLGEIEPEKPNLWIECQDMIRGGSNSSLFFQNKGFGQKHFG